MLGRPEEAAHALSRAIAAAPDDAGAHYTRAVYRSHVDPDDPGVRADLDRAVELAPQEAAYLRERAEYRMKSEEYDLAVADLERAVALRPEDAALHYLRGKCLTEPVAFRWSAATQAQVFDDADVRQCEAALVPLERALELAPKDGELYEEILCAIAGARQCMPDRDAYLAVLDRALLEMPTHAAFLSLRGDARRDRGDLPGAASDLASLKELGVEL